jgi:hypothetical protein
LSTTSIPHFVDGSLHAPTERDAHVHVRVAEPLRSNGSMTVYLLDGTALIVV